MNQMIQNADWGINVFRIIPHNHVLHGQQLLKGIWEEQLVHSRKSKSGTYVKLLIIMDKFSAQLLTVRHFEISASHLVISSGRMIQ